MSIANLLEWRREGADLRSIAEKLFNEFIEENRIDVIKAHNLHLGFHPYSEALIDICKERGIPVFLVLHNDFLEWEGKPKKEEEMWRILEYGWDSLVSVSEYIKRALSERRPSIKEKRWRVILHGIDLERFSPVDEKKRTEIAHRYGLSGKDLIYHPARMGIRVEDGKGILSTFKIMPQIIDLFPDALLLLSGGGRKIVDIDRGTEEPVISVEEDLISRLGIERNIHIGDYGFEDVPNLYRIAKVVVCPSQEEEPFGLCPVEAMACGVPVIVTNSGGLVESVVDGVSGFVIEKHRTLEELPAKIVELLGNEDLAKRMGREGRRRVIQRFDKRRMAKDFISLSLELLRL
jgi:spore coat protein SA